MNLEKYELSAGNQLRTFEFISEGKKGKIVKLIQFQQMNLKNLFNLAFGDKNSSGSFDDLIVTDNGDSEKVLVTVVSALYEFTAYYPESWVFITGSTPTRTRLYRIGINKYYEIVSNDFDIMGLFQNEWENYELGKDYQAFAIHKK